MTNPFALPPFTHLRLRKIEPAPNAARQHQGSSGNTSMTTSSEPIQQILSNVQQGSSGMTPFNTGVHAYRTVPGIQQPPDPFGVQQVRKGQVYLKSCATSFN